MLNEVLARLTEMEPTAKHKVAKEIEKSEVGSNWMPTWYKPLLTPSSEPVYELNAETGEKTQVFTDEPSPQRLAYFSKADVLLYGGEGGGGKSDLLLGLAFEAHEKSLIMRRQYNELGALLERAIQINGSSEGVNRSPPPKVRTSRRKLIEFGAAQHIGDEENWQGQPHDLLGFDEVVQFAESQVRFLQGWVRTTTEGQRTRTVFASNPPVLSQGDWIIGMFRPWLDLTHPNPAKEGELRWYVVDPDGKDMEVDGPEPVEFDGRKHIPESRSFIGASVRDNPYLLRDPKYLAKLDGMQEPWRSAIRDGNFMAVRADQQNQVIRSEWVRDAQLRWTPDRPKDLPMTAIGVDVAVSEDNTCLAPRYDWWYAPLVVVPGNETPTGRDCATLIVHHRRSPNAEIVVDVGGGYGGPVVDALADNHIEAHRFNGANGAYGRTKDRTLGFFNKRAEAWWRFREALDPDQEFGSPVCLPDDPMLAGELTAPTFEVTPRGILIEPKDKVKERLGRSPDRADAVVMAWSEGQNALLGRTAAKSSKPKAFAKVGYAHMKRRRMRQ